jgi:prenyltransferase beta subunit
VHSTFFIKKKSYKEATFQYPEAWNYNSDQQNRQIEKKAYNSTTTQPKMTNTCRIEEHLEHMHITNWLTTLSLKAEQKGHTRRCLQGENDADAVIIQLSTKEQSKFSPFGVRCSMRGYDIRGRAVGAVQMI